MKINFHLINIIPQKYNEQKIQIANENEKYYLDNSFNSNDIRIVPTNKFVAYITKEEKYDLKSRNIFRTHNYSVMLPQKISLDEKDIAAIGALQGELRKSLSRPSDVKFTNSIPSLHSIVLDFYKKFGINEENISWKIVGLRNASLKKDALDYWIKNTNFKKECFKGYRFSNGKVLSKTPIYGTVEMWIRKGRKNKNFNNTLFFIIIRNLIKTILKESVINKEIAINLLQGLFAAEGFVDAKSRFCGLSSSDKNELYIYREILNNIGMKKISEFKDALKFYSKDFQIVKTYNLFNYCRRKQKQFLSMFSRQSLTKLETVGKNR